MITLKPKHQYNITASFKEIRVQVIKKHGSFARPRSDCAECADFESVNMHEKRNTKSIGHKEAHLILFTNTGECNRED